jgi:hypothetical protein
MVYSKAKLKISGDKAVISKFNYLANKVACLKTGNNMNSPKL